VAAPLSEITAIVRQLLGNNDIELTPATCFDDVPGWDSMDLVSVVVEVECRFDVQFELFEIEHLFTVGNLMDMVVAKRALTTA
jgi:acyl carrier protein